MCERESGLVSSCRWSKSVDSLCISGLFSPRCKLRSIFRECAEMADSLCTFSRFISSLCLSSEMFCWARLLFSSFPLLSCLLCCVQCVSCIYLYIYSLMPFWPVIHVRPFAYWLPVWFLVCSWCTKLFCVVVHSFSISMAVTVKCEHVWMWSTWKNKGHIKGQRWSSHMYLEAVSSQETRPICIILLLKSPNNTYSLNKMSCKTL